MKHTSLFCMASLLAGLVGTGAAPAESQPAPAKPRIEVCFVLDTTGSMSGLIEGAKQKIWSIANEMIAAKPTPELRFGLIGYRDRGDEYVVKHFDLTGDIDAIYGHLQGFRAGGGGDTPESVNEALQAAVRQMSWSEDRSVLKIVFLVGDAPPHMDYDGPKYPAICQEAVKKDLVINTVQCGGIAETGPIWREIASLAEGKYAAIAQSGNMAVVSTPMDAELARLNRELGGTLVAYGRDDARAAVMFKQAASEAAPAAVAADRLAFNAVGKVTVQGGGELLDSLASGKIKLAEVKKEELPQELRSLDEKGLKAEIDKRTQRRAEIQASIEKLNRERAEYLKAEQKRLADSSKADSFDEQVALTLRSQAARKGINYGK